MHSSFSYSDSAIGRPFHFAIAKLQMGASKVCEAETAEQTACSCATAETAGTGMLRNSRIPRPVSDANPWIAQKPNGIPKKPVISVKVTRIRVHGPRKYLCNLQGISTFCVGGRKYKVSNDNP